MATSYGPKDFTGSFFNLDVKEAKLNPHDAFQHMKTKTGFFNLRTTPGTDIQRNAQKYLMEMSNDSFHVQDAELRTALTKLSTNESIVALGAKGATPRELEKIAEKSYKQINLIKKFTAKQNEQTINASAEAAEKLGSFFQHNLDSLAGLDKHVSTKGNIAISTIPKDTGDLLDKLLKNTDYEWKSGQKHLTQEGLSTAKENLTKYVDGRKEYLDNLLSSHTEGYTNMNKFLDEKVTHIEKVSGKKYIPTVVESLEKGAGNEVKGAENALAGSKQIMGKGAHVGIGAVLGAGAGYAMSGDDNKAAGAGVGAIGGGIVGAIVHHFRLKNLSSAVHNLAGNKLLGQMAEVVGKAH